MLLFKPALILVVTLLCVEHATVLINRVWSGAPNQHDNSDSFASRNIECVKNKRASIPASCKKHSSTTKDVNSKGILNEDPAYEYPVLSEERDAVLAGLTKIQQQLQHIRDNIELSLNPILNKNAENARRYEQDLEKVVKINETLHYIGQVAGPTLSEVANRLEWIDNLIDNRSEKLYRIYGTILHVFYLLGVVIAATFLHAPIPTRIMIVGMITLNLRAISKNGNTDGCFDFTSITTLIIFVTGIHYLIVKVEYSEVKDIYIKINQNIYPLLGASKNKIQDYFIPEIKELSGIAVQVFTYCKDEVVIPIRTQAASWYQTHFSISPLVGLVWRTDLNVEKLPLHSDLDTKRNRGDDSTTDIQHCLNISRNSRDLTNSLKVVEETNQDDSNKLLPIERVSYLERPSKMSQNDPMEGLDSSKIGTIKKLQDDVVVDPFSTEISSVQEESEGNSEHAFVASITIDQNPTTKAISTECFDSSNLGAIKKLHSNVVVDPVSMTEISTIQKKSGNASDKFVASSKIDPGPTIKSIPTKDLESFELETVEKALDDSSVDPFSPEISTVKEDSDENAEHGFVARTVFAETLESLGEALDSLNETLGESGKKSGNERDAFVPSSKIDPSPTMKSIPKKDLESFELETVEKKEISMVQEESDGSAEDEFVASTPIDQTPTTTEGNTKHINSTNTVDESQKINTIVRPIARLTPNVNPNNESQRTSEQVNLEPPNTRPVQPVTRPTPSTPTVGSVSSQAVTHPNVEVAGQFTVPPNVAHLSPAQPDNEWLEDIPTLPSSNAYPPHQPKRESSQYDVQSILCGAMTQKGTPCRNKPSSGGPRCWRHGANVPAKPNYSSFEESTLMPSSYTYVRREPIRESPCYSVHSGLCGAMTQKGTPCRNSPSYGGSTCWRH